VLVLLSTLYSLSTRDAYSYSPDPTFSTIYILKIGTYFIVNIITKG
jgi:hypothetical protein